MFSHSRHNRENARTIKKKYVFSIFCKPDHPTHNLPESRGSFRFHRSLRKFAPVYTKVTKQSQNIIGTQESQLNFRLLPAESLLFAFRSEAPVSKKRCKGNKFRNHSIQRNDGTTYLKMGLWRCFFLMVTQSSI